MDNNLIFGIRPVAEAVEAGRCGKAGTIVNLK